MTRRHDHCPECGVPAGLVCRDNDDRPAVETCHDRPLLPIRDKAPVSRRDLTATSVSTLNRRKAGTVGAPAYAPCLYCGTSTRLWGGAIDAGHTVCREVACKKRHAAAKRKRQREAARGTAMVRCFWCDVEVTEGRRKHAARPCCGDVECHRARKRLMQIGYRNTVTTLTT